MALRVLVLPGQRSFRPGEALRAKIEVANCSDTHSPTAFSLLIASFTVECYATERVDRTWVSLAYGAEVPPLEKDSRRETREVFHTQPTELAAGFRLQPGEQRSWNVKLSLPEWLPPSFRGIAARYSYVLMASISFSGSPAAMQLLAHHLSLDQARRHTSGRGSLLTLPSASLPSQVKGGPKPAPQEPPAEQTAVAKVPLLLLPVQRLQADFGDRRLGQQMLGGVVTGEESELQPIAYGLGPVAEPPSFDVEEVMQVGEPPAKAGRSLPRGVSVSRSDLWNRPEGGSPLASDSVQPLDAWPSLPPPGRRPSRDFDPRQTGASRAGFEGDGRLHDAERQSPMPPATPMTGAEPSALRNFNLRLADNALVRLALHPPQDGPVCLGATLSGTLDFRGSQEASARDSRTPKCVQVVVLLETEERVHRRWLTGAPAQPATSGIRKVQDEHQELTPDTVLTHFMLSIPADAPASFSTHLISLRWLLRFEFTTSKAKPAGGWLGGAGRGTEKLTWTLPLLVGPPGR